MLVAFAIPVRMLQGRSRATVIRLAERHQYPGIPAQRQCREQQDKDQGFGKPSHEKNRITSLDDQTAWWRRSSPLPS